jgi:hypothetical protein
MFFGFFEFLYTENARFSGAGDSKIFRILDFQVRSPCGPRMHGRPFHFETSQSQASFA